MMVADQFYPLDEAAGFVIQVERAEFAAAGPQKDVRVSCRVQIREKGMAH